MWFTTGDEKMIQGIKLNNNFLNVTDLKGNPDVEMAFETFQKNKDLLEKNQIEEFYYSLDPDSDSFVKKYKLIPIMLINVFGSDYLTFFNGTLPPHAIFDQLCYSAVDVDDNAKISLPSNITVLGPRSIEFYHKAELDLGSVEVIKEGAVVAYAWPPDMPDVGTQLTLVIPSTVRKIEKYGFINSKFGQVKFEGPIEEVNGFNNCDIKSVSLKEGTMVIGEEAFMGCSSLKKIELPSSIKSIKDKAFLNCGKLKDIYLPRGLEHIGEKVFSSWTNCTVHAYNDQQGLLRNYSNVVYDRD